MLVEDAVGEEVAGFAVVDADVGDEVAGVSVVDAEVGELVASGEAPSQTQWVAGQFSGQLLLHQASMFA